MKRANIILSYPSPFLNKSHQKIFDTVVSEPPIVNSTVLQNAGLGALAGGVVAGSGGFVMASAQIASALLSSPFAWTPSLSLVAEMTLGITLSYAAAGAAAVGLPAAVIGYGVYRFTYRCKASHELKQEIRDIFRNTIPYLFVNTPKNQSAACAIIYKYSTDNFLNTNSIHRELYVLYSLFSHQFINYDLIKAKLSTLLPLEFPYESFWSQLKTLTGCEDKDYNDGYFAFIFSDSGTSLYVVPMDYFKKYVLSIPIADVNSVTLEGFYKYAFGAIVYRPLFPDTISECSVLLSAYNKSLNKSQILIEYLFHIHPALRDKIKNATLNSRCLAIQNKLINSTELVELDLIISNYISANHVLNTDTEQKIYNIYNYSHATVHEKSVLLHAVIILCTGLTSSRFLGTESESTVPLRRFACVCVNSLQLLNDRFYQKYHGQFNQLKELLLNDTCSAFIANRLFSFFPTDSKASVTIRQVIPTIWWSGIDLYF